MCSEHSDDWSAKIHRFIVDGETPRADGPWDYPTPETHLACLYAEAQEPPPFRDALRACIRELLRQGDAAHEALGRALRLVRRVPHSDFSDVLRRVFFEESESDLARLALQTMYALQRQLTENQRDVWRAMWLALLADAKHGISAYHGLRSLDLGLAIRNLPVLLDRVDLHSHGLTIMLDGLAGELGERLEEQEVLEALTKTLAGLSEQKRQLFRSAFVRAFGENRLEAATQAALARARSELEERLGAVVKESKSPMGDLLRQLCEEAAKWLIDRCAVEAVSVWLIDEEKEHAAFLTQRGCPRDPPKLFFKLGTSQDSAEHLAGKAWRAGMPLARDMAAPDCDVCDCEKFVAKQLLGAYAIPSRSPADAQPRLSIVVDLFARSKDALERLDENGGCVQHVDLVREVCQALIRRRSEQLVARLSDELDRAPALSEVFEAFNGQIRSALSCKLTSFGLDHPGFEEYVSLKTAAASSDKPFVPYALDQELVGRILKTSIMRRSVDPRDRKVEDPNNKSGRDVDDEAADEAILALVDPSESSRECADFMGRALRQPAPRGFTGVLVGIAHLYRRGDAASDIGYTPIDAYLFQELCRVANPLIADAFSSLREQTRQEKMLHPGAAGNGDMESRLEACKGRLRRRVSKLINEWLPSSFPRYKRAFVSFRTFVRGSGSLIPIGDCQPVWFREGPSQEDKEARRELRRRLRDNVSVAFHNESSAVLVDHGFLGSIGVGSRSAGQLCALNLVLVPVLQKEARRGVIGLEYGRPQDAADAVGWINKQANGTFVQRCVSEYWDYYRDNLKPVIADCLERWSEDCQEQIGGRDQLLEFLKFGFRLDERSRSSSPWPQYRDFVQVALGDPDYGDDCDLYRAWNERARFLGADQQEFKGQHVKCWAKDPNVRAVFVTATTFAENGSSLSLSPGQDKNRAMIHISTDQNGCAELAERGRQLACEIARHQGWGVKREDSGLTIELPLYPTMPRVP